MRSRSVAQESIISLAALLILALVAAGPLWGPGLLNTRGGGDSPFNLLRVHQLAANLRAGVFPARWMPDAAYGLGYPFYNYYAALPYYLAAGLTVIGVDILSAIKLTQTIFFAAAAAGMYGWARQALHSRAGGWLAAVAYTVAPYHLVNVYVRGDSLSEFAAFAFYPLILWGFDRLAKRPSLRRTIPPALAYASLILTHNLSAFIFSLFVLLPYTAFHVLRLTFQVPHLKFRKLLHIVSSFIGALLIGMLLTSWYWLPAIIETGDVQLTAQTSGYFAYDKHFRGKDLIQFKFIFDYYTITPEKPTAFAAMGLVQTLATIAGTAVVILAYIRSRAARLDLKFEIPYLTFALTGLLLTTWLITPLSRPLWDLLPPLQMIQFPWRILSVQALFTALLAGAISLPIAPPMEGKGKVQQWIVPAALALVLTIAGLAGLRPEYLPIAAEEVTVERLQLYELFTGNIGSTIRYEYLPRSVVPRPFTGPTLFAPDTQPRAIPLSGGLVRAEETVHKPTRRVWEVEPGTGGAVVTFPIYYWPGWQAMVDDTSTQVQPALDSGCLTLSIPAGKHTVTMWLGRTPLRLGAELVSLVTVSGLLAYGFFTWWQEARSKSQKARYSPFAICYLLFAASLILLVLFHPRVDTNTTDLTMDFDSLPYLHHNPGGAAFDGWRLLGYTYNTDRLAPGNTLQVTLDWELERSRDADATLQLVSPAAIRQKELVAIAATTLTITPQVDSLPLDLPIPNNVGPGMYLLRLTDGTAKVYLRPIWISAEESDANQPSATFAGEALQLHTIEIKQTTHDQLDLRFDWSAEKPVAANYGISLRLTDPASNEWARTDTQPGYGFLPTSLWPVAQRIHDHYTLRLPEGTPPGKEYTLTVILYHTSSGESVGEHHFPVSLDRAALQPDAPTAARFGDELALSRLEIPETVGQGESLHVTAYWLAIEQPVTNYAAEWQLESAGHTITSTLPLASGSSPTTWPIGAWVAGRATLSIPPTTPPGAYTLSLTLREPAGASLGSYTHPQLIRVEERGRVWELPEMQQEVGARFGNAIELAGYDLAREGDTLRLTLYWRALVAPERHHMFFVHVADPTTGVPVTQIDTMPRGYTYPTGMWTAGEVISDEVKLSLADVPPGQYDLAIGWYDPDNPSQRLPATDAMDNPLPDNRLVLPDGITTP
ncbi:MAG: 6-pyruvoyl-tetrahydropterin synthase-related protein [Anaerolineae bacterium]